MKLIPLTQGQSAMVDNVDYEVLSQYKWYYGGRGYAIRHSKMVKGVRTKIYMHREITGAPEKHEIDHKNGNRIDNRRKNLRICTRMQNLWNAKPQINNKSGYKGVYWDKKIKKWYTSFMNKRFGSFSNKVEAAKLYNKVILKYRGKYAYLNSV